MSLPLVFSSTGVLPASPATLRAALLTSVAATNPGYTANLPGSLIENVSSTDVGAILLCDSALVELVNSLTPYGANPFVLSELGQCLGVAIGGATNTSVFVVFTGPNGYIISPGFTVSDGTYQYVVPDGGVIGSGGVSPALFAVAILQGAWAVPAATVTQLVTSVPSTINLSVTNPASGTPGDPVGETEEQYRSRVLDANLAVSQGTTRYLKTLLAEVPGVQARLISVRQANGGWEIICGGGDPYAIAGAIFDSIFDLNDLVGSVIEITGITNANPGVVTTNLNHGLTTGQANVDIAGVVGMTGVNGGPYTVTVITETTFSFGVNTTSSGAYVSGGVVTPNTRNVAVSISDPPDVYLITYVNPPEQAVTIDVTWNTNSPNFVSAAAIAQLGAPALADYVNALGVGVPMNLFELQTTFQEAISSVLAPQLLTRMVFTVNINGISTSPSAGTGIIAGDPESYFLTTVPSIIITQG